MNDREELIRHLVNSPQTAHRLFFGQSHAFKTPKFHGQIIDDWHSSKPRVLTMAFRGAAKSTLAEESISVIAALGQTKNCVILGESEARAAERLASIKHHFETNEYIQKALDIEPGDIWTDTRATISNGAILQAYGRYQSLRGVKHLDRRPDLVFADDLEDKESVATPEARRKTRQWWASTVIPALARVGGRVRMAATPLHPEALAPTLAKTKAWLTRTCPIIYKDENGEWAAIWPDMYPVEWALAKKEEMDEMGQGEDFVQEYLCQATDPASQTFTEDMFRIAPRVRSYHAVYAVYDPARTTNKASATTGKAVCSWIGRKLVVWESFARKMMPDEIINDIFETDERYNPVAIGFEENGLNEWALQPIRTEQLKRGYTLPLRSLSAPKGKFDFIRGLQPYFKAGEVEFASDMPDLRQQLLGFPTGLIDAPNALAYMLRMKLGEPIYENFSDEHVHNDRRVNSRSPLYLCVNTDGRTTAGVLAQMLRGQCNIYADWLYEGDAGQVLPDIIQAARLEAAGAATSSGGAQGLPPSSLRLVAPKEHFDDYSTLALRAVARQCKCGVSKGGAIETGRAEFRARLQRSVHNEPAIRICASARWTLRGFAGGYARDANSADPMPGAYAVLFAALESFGALLRAGVDALDTAPNFAYTEDGRRYISALARS